jgi:hypothetical protein
MPLSILTHIIVGSGSENATVVEDLLRIVNADERKYPVARLIKQPLPQNRVLLEKPLYLQLSKNSLPFMEPASSLPFS